MTDVLKNDKNKNEKDKKIYKNFVDYCYDHNLDLVEEMKKELKKVMNLNIDVDYKIHIIMELIFEIKYDI